MGGTVEVIVVACGAYPGQQKDHMAGGIITADQFPSGTSRYTLAMAKCLGSGLASVAATPSGTIVQTLINLVQGRMLEYLADRICRGYDIQDRQARQRVVSALLGIFSDEFFALFRSRIEFRPHLVIQIARRIIRKEAHAEQRLPGSPVRQPADRLYPAIFRKYFEYRNLGNLLEMVESDAEIQKIILATLLEKQLPEPDIYRQIMQILAEDDEGIASNLFMGYITDNDLGTLVNKVQSGAWKSEMQALKRRLAHLRGE